MIGCDSLAFCIQCRYVSLVDQIKRSRFSVKLVNQSELLLRELIGELAVSERRNSKLYLVYTTVINLIIFDSECQRSLLASNIIYVILLNRIKSIHVYLRYVGLTSTLPLKINRRYLNSPGELMFRFLGFPSQP